MKKLLCLSVACWAAVTSAMGQTAVNAASGTDGLSDLDYIIHHTKVLSGDDFGGRKPMSAYEDKTIAYIRDEFAALGLQPACETGYFQPVSEIRTRTTLRKGALQIQTPGGKVTVKAPDEVIPWTVRNTSQVDIRKAGMVFAGFGITAPEHDWDDYAGVDVAGKVVLVLENDPGLYDETLFGGRNMTYYGRAECKFREAQRRGAAGCLVVHIPSTSAYKYAGLQGAHGAQEIALAGGEALGLSGWVAEDAVKRVFKSAGLDYEAAVHSAAVKGFRAVPMDAALTATLDVQAETGTSHNVIGVLPGTDLKDECVVVTAHWDHLGIGAPVDGDSIYNGASDNAVGVAGMLAHIRRFMADGTALRRSVVFASVTSEEDGLLGSEWYCTHPLFPIEKTAGAVNIDGGAPLGKARNIEVYAGGLSTVDDMVRALATAQGRRTDIQNPDTRGIFFRTDLFNFLRAGIPGVFVCGGQDYVDPAEHARHVKPPYHHPDDEWSDLWDMAGVMDQWNLIHGLIELLANQPDMPQWLPGSGFSRPK